MWFKNLTGFSEISPEEVRKNIMIKGNKLFSMINQRSFQHGHLEIATLESLKERVSGLKHEGQAISFIEIIGNAQQFHKYPSNQNALFQAASQFNLLEMVGPEVTPESGINGYELDHTQGPACAIACGAGTIYRNYFAPVNGKVGQSYNNQIDCLDLIGKELGNVDNSLWEMKNGYALADQNGIDQINILLKQLTNKQWEFLKGKLKIGLQWDTEVTLSDNKHLVSQAYCSALPVAYSYIESEHWELFAKLILEATYEATLYAAMVNLNNTGCPKVYLTMVGGGAFGNQQNWIIDALVKAMEKFRHTPLNVKMISYNKSNPSVKKIEELF